MREFPIYRVISHNEKTGGMEISVLAIRVGASGAQRQVSVNRHVHRAGNYWLGRHPDFYDGVDAKNTIAETVMLDLEHELEDAKILLEHFEEQLKKTAEAVRDDGVEASSVDKKERLINLFIAVEGVRSTVAFKGMALESARESLARVQEEFPRLVSYVHVHSRRE